MQCSVPDPPERSLGETEAAAEACPAPVYTVALLGPLEPRRGQPGPLKALPRAPTGPGRLCLWSVPCSPEGLPGRGWQVESPRRGPSLGTRSRVPGEAQAGVRTKAKAGARLTQSSKGRCGCEGVRAEVG